MPTKINAVLKAWSTINVVEILTEHRWIGLKYC